MFETRRVTHLWIQALPSPDIGRQRVFTACLWKLKRVLADPPSAPVRTLAESVLQWVSLERGPLERCQWRGQPGTRIFLLRILDSRGAPDRAAAFSGPRGINKISEASKTYSLEGNPQAYAASPRGVYCRRPDSGFWILD